jgi:hypothetical protein
MSNWSEKWSKAMKRFKKGTDEKRRRKELDGIQKRFKEINEDYDKDKAKRTRGSESENG